MARGKDTPTARWGYSRNQAKRLGYRSSYELAIAVDLDERHVPYEYEAKAYDLRLLCPRNIRCDCGTSLPYRVSKYTPDFTFFGGLFVVEAKGRFDPAHRAKALAFVEQYPGIEYALLFEADNLLSRKSKTRYTQWCDKHEILSAVGLVPREWLEGAVREDG